MLHVQAFLNCFRWESDLYYAACLWPLLLAKQNQSFKFSTPLVDEQISPDAFAGRWQGRAMLVDNLQCLAYTQGALGALAIMFAALRFEERRSRV